MTGTAPRTGAFPDVVPLLTDGVVTLRAHRESDVDAVVEQCNDPASVAFTTVPQPYGPAQGRAYVGSVVPAGWDAPLGTKAWAVEAVDDRGTTRFAGSVDYRPTPAATAEVGFGLHPWARGRGLMSRALRLVLAHAFDSGVQTAHWRAHVGNWASRRVAWSCGFRVEGTVRDLLDDRRGTAHDGWVASLRRGEPMTPAHPWFAPAVLEGPTVRLRPWREADAPRPDQRPDAASLRFMPAGSHPTPGEFADWLTTRRARMAEGEGHYWCVADRSSDEVLGHIQCFRMNHPLTARSAQVGYWLHPAARGHGAMTQALQLVVAHAFGPPGGGGLALHRLAAGTDADNVASQRVLRRAGFRLLGIERAAVCHEDRPPTDGPLFDLLADDDGEPVEERSEPLPPPPVMSGERIRLRPWRDSDAAALLAASAHPASGVPTRVRDEEGARRWIARRRRLQLTGAALFWAVADAATDTAVGAVTVHGLDNPLGADGTALGADGAELGAGGAELGYFLHPDRRGAGLTNEALDLVIPWVLMPVDEGGLGRRRVTARTDPGDIASQTVLRRAGLTPWGRETSARPPQGGAASRGVVHFSVTRDDDRITAAALSQARALHPVTIEGQTQRREHGRRRRRIRLRGWRDSDAAQVLEACSDDATRHWLAGLPAPYSIDDARDYVAASREAHQRGSALFWCVADGGSDDCIGAISVMGLDMGDGTSGEVGYWTHPDARDGGVMTEAVRLAVRHAFVSREDGGLGLRRLQLNVADGNEGSATIARRNGFIEVGRDRRAERLGDGTFADLVRFDLLEGEPTP